jgi:hypothetical protein
LSRKWGGEYLKMFELFYLHGIITEEFTYQKEPLLYIHK